MFLLPSFSGVAKGKGAGGLAPIIQTLSVFGVEAGGNADLKQKASTRHQC